MLKKKFYNLYHNKEIHNSKDRNPHIDDNADGEISNDELKDYLRKLKFKEESIVVLFWRLNFFFYLLV